MSSNAITGKGFLGLSERISFLSLPLWLGSCLSLNQNLEFQEIPANLSTVENYILGEEEKIEGLTPGTNKRIVWLDGARKQTEYSLIYLPGYSSTRQEIAPIPERVSRAMGMNLYDARFKGNGVKGGGDSYKGVTVQDHLRDAYEALSIGKIIGQKVIIMGTSTGAPFGFWLAHRFPDHVAGLVFVSPNNAPSEGRSVLILGPFGPSLARFLTRGYLRSDVVNNRFAGEPVNRSQELQYSSQVQHIDATIAMMGIVAIVSKINPENYSFPYLMIYSDKDMVVSTKAFKNFFKNYGKNTLAPKEAVAVVGSPARSQHAMVGDLTDPRTTDPIVGVIVAFLERNIGKTLPSKGKEQEVIYREIEFNF